MPPLKMPNYKASNFWFNSVSAMSSFALDNSDEDGLVFGVGEGSTSWGLYAWRKSSTEAVDNATIFPANGPGRWVRLGASSGDTNLAWATLTAEQWAALTAEQWANMEAF